MPTSITGPDNNEYEFPDGTTKDQAIAYFKAKGIGVQAQPPAPTGLTATASPESSSSVSAPAVPPSLITRFGQAVGLPTSKEELEAAQPTLAEKIGGPAVTAGRLGYNYLKNLYQQGKSAVNEAYEAGQNIGEGGPVLPNIGKDAAALSDFVLRGVAAPIGGGGVANFGEDVANKNYQGATGDALGTVVNALLLKGRNAPTEATTTNKLGFAIGPSGGTVSALERTMPELEKTIEVTGARPKTIGELAEVVHDTANRLEQPFNVALQKSADRKIVPTQIADALRAKADTLPPTATAEINALHDAAKVYDQTWTIKDLNKERMYRNSLSRPYYNKSGTAQMNAMRSNADMMIDKIVADQSRDLLYNELDRTNPGSNFAKNKGTVSNLLDIMDQLDKRVEQLKDAQAVVKGAPLLDKPGISAYVHKNNITPGVHMGSVISSLIGRGPEGAANAAVKGAYRNPMAMNSAARAAVLTMPLRNLTPAPEAVPPSMKMSGTDQQNIQEFLNSLPQ